MFIGNLLQREGNFKILLVNARHIKNVTDKKDSKWIAKLLLSGLLQGSNYTTQGNKGIKRFNTLQTIIESEKNRIQKILEDLKYLEKYKWSRQPRLYMIDGEQNIGELLLSWKNTIKRGYGICNLTPHQA